MARHRGSKQNRYSTDEIAEALRVGGGVMTKAAEALGCNRETIEKRVKDNEELQEIILKQREAAGDLAEDTFMKALRLENILLSRALEAAEAGALMPDVPRLPATFFGSKTLNKNRGYSQTHEVTGPGGRPLVPGSFVVERPEKTSDSFEEWSKEFKPTDGNGDGAHVPEDEATPE
jgi:hypothetical protein